MTGRRCVRCLRADYPQRVRAVVLVGGQALCAFHALRAPHPTSCRCAECDDEAARELAAAFPGAERARVVVAGRLARAIRRVREDERKRGVA